MYSQEVLHLSQFPGILHLQGDVKVDISEAQQEPEQQQRKVENGLMEQLTDDNHSDMKVNPLQNITLFATNGFL